MELYIAIPLVLVILALIVSGEIYLGMDKLRSRAAVCVSHAKRPLDDWVSLTVELASRPGTSIAKAENLRALADTYFGTKKYRDRFKKVPLVNAMAELSEKIVKETPGIIDERITNGRADAADAVEPLRREYNNCAQKLNKRLKRRIPAAIGKLLGISPLEEFRVLPVE
jgi:hypothetical protein